MICQWVFNIRAPSNKNATFAYCFSQKKQPPATIFSQNLPLLNRFTPSNKFFFFHASAFRQKSLTSADMFSEQKIPMEKWIAIWLQESLIYILYFDFFLFNYRYIVYRYIISFSNYLDLFLAMKHILSTEFFFEGRTKDHGSDPFNVWWCWKSGRLFFWNPVKDVKDLPTIMGFK